MPALGRVRARKKLNHPKKTKPNRNLKNSFPEQTILSWISVTHIRSLQNLTIASYWQNSPLPSCTEVWLLFFCDSKTHTKYNSLENSCHWDNFVSISTLSEDTLYGRIQILTLFLQVLKNIETLGSSIWTSLEGFPLVQILAVLKRGDLERIVFDVVLKDDS